MKCLTRCLLSWNRSPCGFFGDRIAGSVRRMVLATAVNGGADLLATFNVRHLRKAAMEFGVRAAPPGDVWQEVKGARNEKK